MVIRSDNSKKFLDAPKVKYKLVDIPDEKDCTPLYYAS